MKLDTSSYYPEPYLNDDDDKDESTPSADKVTVVGAETQDKAVDLPDDSGYDNEPDRSQPPTSFEKFTDGVATLVSWILVPLLMPVYGVLLSFHTSIRHFTPFHVKLSFVLITLAFTLALPSLLVILLKKIGVVKDIGLNRRRERLIPYIITFVSMAGTGVFMYFKGAPMWLVMFFGGGAVAGLVNLTVNFWWKISAHAAGIAGVVALMIRIINDGYPLDNAFGWMIASIILAGLMGSSRVWLGRHTVWQVLAGYTVGFSSVFLMTLIQ